MTALGALLGVLGACAAILGLFLFLRAPAEPAGSAPSSPASSSGETLSRPWLLALVGILVVAALLRLIGLDARGMSHPEAYIPGLPFPAGLSEPPPRHGIVETVKWHFHSEPHPFGYYFAMWGWTKLFGTSLFTIRLPHAILGVLSVALIYRVAALAYGVRAGVIAAGLLALHGFHIYWSQTAKMYAPGGFMGLLSTWLLLELARRQGPQRLLTLAYVAATVGTALTVEFMWPLLCVQMLWVALNHKEPDGRVPRLAVAQAYAFVLAAPMLSHAMMTGRNEAAPPPTLEFLADFFSFGFAFQHGSFSEPWPGLPFAAAAVVFVVSLVLIALGLLEKPEEPVEPAPAGRGWLVGLVVSALGASALMLAFAVFSWVRQKEMVVLAALPLLVLVAPVVIARLRQTLRSVVPALDRLFEQAPAVKGLIPLLAFIPAVGIFLISFKVTLTAPRAFLIFVPYVVILVAAGLDRLARRPVVGGAAVAAVAAGLCVSAVMMYQVPSTPRDYRGLAYAIEAELKPGDEVFIIPKHWLYTPILYYLPMETLVARDYAGAVKTRPHPRVWLLTFGKHRPTPEMQQAVKGLQPEKTVRALSAEATLYEAPAATAPVEAPAPD